MNDLRHAWRSIARMPVLATVVVVSLGVGIGVNTAVFSWVQAMFLQPLPGVRNVGRMQLVEPRSDTSSYPGTSWPEYKDLRRFMPSVPDLVAFRMVGLSVGEPGHVERGYGQLVSGNYFSALGLTPAQGRFFDDRETQTPGGAPVIVVSYDYWQTHLGADRTAIGRTIRVNDRLLTIVGVAPKGFKGTVLMLMFDIWAPATLAPVLLPESRELDDRSLRGYSVIAPLAPSVGVPQVQAELDRAMTALARSFPETNAKIRGEVMPFWQAPHGPQRMLGAALLSLQGLMLLLLLAVCGNTANLMLARASARQREIGTRLALGAAPWRVARLLLTENIVLALTGTVLGAAIAAWATEAMRAVPVLGAFPIRFETHLDSASLAFAMALGIVCGLLCGAAPAWQLARIDPQAALRAGSKNSGRSPLRQTLMAVQVGLALVVLMAAGMFLRSFSESQGADPGFKRDGVLLAAYDLSGRNLDSAAARDFTQRLLARLRALPNVDGAAIAAAVPLDIHGLPSRTFTVEGRVHPEAAPDEALTNAVTPDYFAVMGVPFLAGRPFADLSDTKTAPQAIVNDAFVRRYLEGANPIGRTLETRGGAYTITGVVKTTVSDAFGEAPMPAIYLSYRDRPSVRGEIHLRTRAGAELLLGPQVERVVRELDPTLPVYDVRTLSDHIEKNLVLRRIPARMFVVLGPALLALAAIGIYAVVAYAVSQRTTEIGVRLALGSTPRDVILHIVTDCMRVVAAGAIVGWALAFAVDLHLLRGQMHASVFAGVPALLMIVAAVACWIPARRATAVDPLVALRHE
jgi:putative ABC transport system permease protein